MDDETRAEHTLPAPEDKPVPPATALYTQIDAEALASAEEHVAAE